MSIKLQVKVVPGASSTALVGWYGESLKVRLLSPPEQGKANRELIRFFAEIFEISHRDIQIDSGSRSQMKVVSFVDLSEEDLRKRISALIEK